MVFAPHSPESRTDAAFSEPPQLFAQAKTFHRHRNGKARALQRYHEVFPIDRTREHDDVSGRRQRLQQRLHDLCRPGRALGSRRATKGLLVRLDEIVWVEQPVSCG